MRNTEPLQIPMAIAALCLFLIGPGLQAQTTVVHPPHGMALPESGQVEVSNQKGETRIIKARATTSQSEITSESQFSLAIRPGDLIRTPQDVFCDVLIPSVGTLRLAPESEVRLPAEKSETDKQENSMELLKGKLFMDIDGVALKRQNNQQFRLKTPTTILAVRGTQLFAEARDGVDTAGVFTGEIVVMEVASGQSTAVQSGMAVDSKPGGLGPLRKATEEETRAGDIFDPLTLHAAPAESKSRKASLTYFFAPEEANLPGYIEAKEKVKLTNPSVPEIPGSVLRAAFQPNLEFPDRDTQVVCVVDLNRKVREVPVALEFAIRAKGVLRIKTAGFVTKIKDTQYGVTNTVIEIPADAAPDTWIPVYLPVAPNPEIIQLSNAGGSWDIYRPETGEWPSSLVFIIDPNLHEKRAIEQISQVVPDLPDYYYEISPISVLTRPDPPK